MTIVQFLRNYLELLDLPADVPLPASFASSSASVSSSSAAGSRSPRLFAPIRPDSPPPPSQSPHAARSSLHNGHGHGHGHHALSLHAGAQHGGSSRALSLGGVSAATAPLDEPAVMVHEAVVR